jgi:hypothetical protein
MDGTKQTWHEPLPDQISPRNIEIKEQCGPSEEVPDKFIALVK